MMTKEVNYDLYTNREKACQKMMKDGMTNKLNKDKLTDARPLSLKETVFKEILDALFMALPASIFANIVIGLALVAILWHVIDNTVLVIWFVVLMAISISRFILYKLYLKSSKSIDSLRFWDRLFYILLILTGLTWSFVSLMLLPDSSSVEHYLPALILIGISAGAVTSLGFNMKYITIYFILLLIPLFVSEIILGDYLSYIVALLIVIFIVLALSNAKRINKTMVENIRLHYQFAAHNQSLSESNNAAIKANKVKDHFISMISHELRTPLNAILGFGQLLKMSDDPVLTIEQEDQTQGIIDSGKHLLSLIEELLDLSEIEAGKLKVTITDVSLKSVLDESVTILRAVASADEINIFNEVENEYIVKADHKRLKQVMINLISNAIKYNHLNGKIIISANKISDDVIRVSVTDDGNGLTQEQQSNLFQAFKRFDKKQEGIGLGLYITKKIINLMGGEIGVSSEINKGSTFWFELSLSKDISLN